MIIVQHPARKDWKQLLKRPVIDRSSLEQSVSNILMEVKTGGDKAVQHFSSMFDKYPVASMEVTQEEINAGIDLVSDALKLAIITAKNNITLFHEEQVREEALVETMPGVYCWRKNSPIEKVGLYIPGGTAPLFSTILMLGIPAKIAGCKEIIICTPAGADGKLHPAILYTAHLLGIKKLFKVGGIQAIGAMAYGTVNIPQVYKIFGPGNQYVTCAKQIVQKEGIAIDMPAGPSEVAVYADATANPAFVAADLLSQAEHGIDSQVLLVTTDAQIVPAIQQALEQQLKALPRAEIAEQVIKQSKIIVVHEEAEAIDLLNEYAPEHLILATDDASAFSEGIINAGSIFLGHYSPESVGDYASGTNHTLPTNGYAKAYSGVSVDSFVKKITYQRLSKDGLLAIANTIQLMAKAEGLEAHANAVKVRVEALQ